MPNRFQASDEPSRKSGAVAAHFPLQKTIGKHTKKIVLVMVDDDEDDCILVQQSLTEACFQCTFRYVHSGSEMMEYLHQRGAYRDMGTAPVPDLILLDLNLPGMSGREALTRLKTDPRFRAIPVIILTTSREVEDVKICYDLGANSYITKQPSFEGLSASIRTLMDYWVDVATLPARKTQP